MLSSGPGHAFDWKLLAIFWYGRGPSIVPVEQCRLPAIVPVKSLGTDGNNQQWRYAE